MKINGAKQVGANVHEAHQRRDAAIVDRQTVGAEKAVVQQPFEVEPGMRIAQLVVLPVPELELAEVEELPESERGVRGFGSSRS